MLKNLTGQGIRARSNCQACRGRQFLDRDLSTKEG